MLRDPWTIAHVLARKIFHREDAAFPVHPVDARRKGFCHAMASRPAREARLSIKTGTIERPTSPFAHRVPVTCYKTRKRISPSVSVTRCRPNSRVPSVVSTIPTIFSFFAFDTILRRRWTTRRCPRRVVNDGQEFASQRTLGREKGQVCFRVVRAVHMEWCVVRGCFSFSFLTKGGCSGRS